MTVHQQAGTATPRKFDFGNWRATMHAGWINVESVGGGCSSHYKGSALYDALTALTAAREVLEAKERRIEALQGDRAHEMHKTRYANERAATAEAALAKVLGA